MKIGPNLVQGNLLFGYDTGYGVGNIGAPTRHFKGKPTTNLTTSTLTSVFSSWSGLVGTSTTYTDGYLGGSGVHLVITSGGGVNWWSSPSLTGLSGNTQYTVSATIKSTGTTFDNNLLYIREYNSSNTQLREYGYFNSGRMIDLGDGWYRVWGTVTTQATTNRILLHGYSYNTGNNIKIQDLQFELGDTPSPFAGYNNSRSDTGQLIDLAGQSDISLSNMSFDNTNTNTYIGNPTFDGSGDFIDITTNFGTLAQYSFEYVENPSQTHKMPVSSRLNTDFYKYGAYSWKYKHGGASGEYYHTAGATSGWHHWVITYDGSTISVYQDNISLGTNSSSSGSADWSGGLKIGWWSSGADYDFNGDIPDMKFYDRALTASEVASNFKAYKQRFNI